MHPEKGGDPNDPDTTGSDTLDGGLGNSTLWAGNGPDTLVAGYGTDQLHGGKGDDLIIAGATVDPTTTPPVVNGGRDDTIWAGSGNNTIRGGQGNDTIYGAPQGTFTIGSDGHLAFTTSVTSHNSIQGGIGNNTIYGGPGSDLLIAGTGNDRLYSDSDARHQTTLTAGPGEDWLYAGTGDDLLRLPFGVNANGVRSHFVGGSGHDVLAITTDANDHVIRLTQSSATNFTATSYADAGETQQLGSFNFEVPSDLHGNFIQTLALEAISGNNKLDVAPQVHKNVELKGGTGNDTLIGGGGTNTLIGGTGNDLLQGGPGTPYMDGNGNTVFPYNEFHGGTGSTTMIGGNGDDVFYGGTGDNVMQGGNGRVVMYGGKSLPGQRNHDTMSVGSLNLMVVMIAEANDVTMYGGPGKNVLLGGTGNAEMHAGDGDSVLIGGSGPVTMYGGAGYDVLVGGQGANVLHADDPTRIPPNHSTEDWQTRFDELHDQIAATRAEEDRLTALINNPNTPPDQIPALQAEKATGNRSRVGMRKKCRIARHFSATTCVSFAKSALILACRHNRELKNTGFSCPPKVIPTRERLPFANVLLLVAEQNDVVVWDKNNQPLHEGLIIPVLPAAAASFQLAVPGAPVMAGAMFTVTVTALDAYGNTATGYRGTVHPPASDGQTIAPPDYTFTAADNGTHTFSLALTLAYYRTVTIADTNNLTGSALARINPLAAVPWSSAASKAPARARCFD